jgi:hypothetical protein
MAPDFSVGCLKFRGGVTARITNGLAAPRDRSLTILGDRGSITVRDLWDNRSAVHLESTSEPKQFGMKLVNRAEMKLRRFIPWKPTPGKRLAYPTGGSKSLPSFPSQIDFAAGLAAQAKAIAVGSAPRFSGQLALHITEVALALNNAADYPQPYRPKSGF